MSRQGLMDDTGYHGIDDAEEFAEKYCMHCKHLPIEKYPNGDMWVTDCDKDCTWSDHRFFESEEQG